MTPHLSHLLVTLAVVVLIAWRLQARVRRLIGRQRLSTVRPWITVTLFPALVALLVLGSHTSMLLDGALTLGVVLGIALGLVGLRMTRFEVASDGLYYTPSAHLGVALSLLVVGRLVWRFLFMGAGGAGAALAAGAGPAPPPSLTPTTLLLLGTLAGYYVTYALGLLRWASRNRGAPRSELSS